MRKHTLREALCISLASFPVTAVFSMADLNGDRQGITEHLSEHRGNAVLLTKHNRPLYVMIRAEEYLKLIRE